MQEQNWKKNKNIRPGPKKKKILRKKRECTPYKSKIRPLLTTIQNSINIKSISENESWAVSAILGLSAILTDVDSYN